jgi:diguanylate cyclase (GGDEF)-like protein/PAS domain S-box-containing protein
LSLRCLIAVVPTQQRFGVTQVLVKYLKQEFRPTDGQNMRLAHDLDTWPAPLAPVISAVEPGSTVLADGGRLALLDALPVAVILIDHLANVRFVNQRTAEIIGLARASIYGRNILDFVLVDDLDFAAELLQAGTGFAGTTMGPSRVRYVDAGGDAHWTQVWASTTPAELGIDGFILTLTSESVRDVLATAVSSVAADNELDRTLAAVARSARAMPLCGRGAILVVQPWSVESSVEDPARFRVIGHWPLDQAAINAPGTPWWRALVAAGDTDVDDVAVDPNLPLGARTLMLSADISALFVRVIRDVAGVVIGVYLVFRDAVGPASSNQRDHLNDAVHLAALAFAQTNRRRELETAAHCDALTGVANRAAFMERLEGERRVVDVLFIDLDHFKLVNDTFGHQTGDLVVAAAAGRIAAAVRQDDVVYRAGGDEFVVVCEAMSDDAERSALAERLVDELMTPFDAGDHNVSIGATVGIASGRNRNLRETVQAADSALYEAKERGRAGWAHAAPRTERIV